MKMFMMTKMKLQFLPLSLWTSRSLPLSSLIQSWSTFLLCFTSMSHSLFIMWLWLRRPVSISKKKYCIKAYDIPHRGWEVGYVNESLVVLCAQTCCLPLSISTWSCEKLRFFWPNAKLRYVIYKMRMRIYIYIYIIKPIRNYEYYWRKVVKLVESKKERNMKQSVHSLSEKGRYLVPMLYGYRLGTVGIAFYYPTCTNKGMPHLNTNILV